MCTFWQTLTGPVGLFYSADCWQEHVGNKTKRFPIVPYVISILPVPIPGRGGMRNPIKRAPCDWLMSAATERLNTAPQWRQLLQTPWKICSNKPKCKNISALLKACDWLLKNVALLNVWFTQLSHPVCFWGGFTIIARQSVNKWMCCQENKEVIFKWCLYGKFQSLKPVWTLTLDTFLQLCTDAAQPIQLKAFLLQSSEYVEIYLEILLLKGCNHYLPSSSLRSQINSNSVCLCLSSAAQGNKSSEIVMERSR